MGIGSWLRRLGESRGEAQELRTPTFEQLEPRLLLSADCLGARPLAPLITSVTEPIVYVDLAGQAEASTASDLPVIATYVVSSDGTDEPVAETEAFLDTGQELASDPSGGPVLQSPDTIGAADATGGTETVLSQGLQNQVPASMQAGVMSQESVSQLSEESSTLLAAGQQDSGSASEILTLEARGPPDANRSLLNAGNISTGSSDPTALVVNPVTHAEEFAGVDVQPSTGMGVRSLGLLGFPMSYDLRSFGDVTSVKNQGAAGTCWIFGTYGSLESTILVGGGVATDFSENHVKNYNGFDGSPTSGGNYFMSQAYLSRWDGPVSEANDPYHDYDDRPSPGGPAQYYVREVLEFDTDSELKTGLMT